MNKLLKFSFLIILSCFFFNCSSDDDNSDNCPENMIVDINDPESIAQAEACGLEPAGPLGRLSNSDSYENLYIYE
ncbi:hypothetical protein [Psychroserpens sp. S379A]|uniref:hypothetical protein n=1 Tax=Psychroserpens sp. S379A TaxID=3415137 RepID=UPI003C79B666